MNRRPIAVVLIGMIATIAGFWTAAYLRQKSCADQGGRWHPQTRLCELSSGEMIGTFSATKVLAGVGVALALGFMLVRIFLHVTGQRGR